MLQQLEPRRLFAVTASLDSDGTLNVASDHAGDHVSIGFNNHGQVIVQAGHHVILAASAHGVTDIQINLGAGNDSLSTDHRISVPMTIRGGLGNDSITAGSGHDAIFGDDGDDQLNSADGAADTVDGGAGNDSALVDHVDVVTHVEHVHHPHPGHHELHEKAIAVNLNELK